MERQPEFARNEGNPRAMRLDSDTELRRALSALKLTRTEREVLLFLSARQRGEGGAAEITVGRDELVAAAGCHSSTVSAACARLQARGLVWVYRRGRGANSFEVNWRAVFERESRPVATPRRVESPAAVDWRQRPDARQLRFEFVNDVACEVVGEAWWGVCVEVGCRVDGFDVATKRDIQTRHQAVPAPGNATSKRDIERQRTTSCLKNATSNENGATSSPLSPEVATTDSFLPSSTPLSSLTKEQKSSSSIGGQEGGLLKGLGREEITVDELRDPARVDALFDEVSRVPGVVGLDGRRTQFHAVAIRCLRVGKAPAGLFVRRLEGPDDFGKPWWLWAGEPGSVDWREAERRIATLDRGGAVVARAGHCGTIPRAPAPPAIHDAVAQVADRVAARSFAAVDDDEIVRRQCEATAALRRRWQKAGAAS